jgi:hypothetical protein
VRFELRGCRRGRTERWGGLGLVRCLNGVMDEITDDGGGGGKNKPPAKFPIPGIKKYL